MKLQHFSLLSDKHTTSKKKKKKEKRSQAADYKNHFLEANFQIMRSHAAQLSWAAFYSNFLIHSPSPPAALEFLNR